MNVGSDQVMRFQCLFVVCVCLGWWVVVFWSDKECKTIGKKVEEKK